LSNDDSELERLKAKRLAEMQRNIQNSQTQNQPEPNSTPTKNSRDVVLERLGFRGLEVLQNAENQFPNETKMIIQKLSELISSGEINETLDGGKLLSLFRAVGISVRMETKINVEKDGKFVSLTDKLSNQTDED
jgi:DNA-binding TFAR19-related protein (PDSD5 family)